MRTRYGAEPMRYHPPVVVYSSRFFTRPHAFMIRAAKIDSHSEPLESE
jgi:hypothetical protein